MGRAEMEWRYRNEMVISDPLLSPDKIYRGGAGQGDQPSKRDFGIPIQYARFIRWVTRIG